MTPRSWRARQDTHSRIVKKGLDSPSQAGWGGLVTPFNIEPFFLARSPEDDRNRGGRRWGKVEACIGDLTKVSSRPPTTVVVDDSVLSIFSFLRDVFFRFSRRLHDAVGVLGLDWLLSPIPVAGHCGGEGGGARSGERVGVCRHRLVSLLECLR